MKALLELLFALILFLVPISYTNSSYNPVIIKAVLTQGLLLSIFILILLLSIRNPHESFDHAKFSRFTKQNIIFLPILFYLVISVLSVTPSPYKYAGIKELSNLTIYILFFFATFYMINKDNIQEVLTVWSISTLLACVIGILDFRHRGVVIGSFGNPNLTASFMAITGPVMVGMFLANVRRAGNRFMRSISVCTLLLASIIIILFVLYLCKSRGAWLALAIGAISFLILSAINNKKRLIITVLAIAILIIIILPCFLMPLTEELIYDVRPFIWRGTLNMIKAHPIIGSGIGTYVIDYPNYRVKEYFFYSHTLGKERGWVAQDVTDHAHSEYLEIAAETGLLGLLAFFSILIVFFILVLKTLQTVKGEINFILIGLTSSVVTALVDNTINISMRFPSTSLFFWFSMGASIAIINDRHICLSSVARLPLLGEPTKSLRAQRAWQSLWDCFANARNDSKGHHARLHKRYLFRVNMPHKIYINVSLAIIIFLLGSIFYKTTWINFRANAYLMKGVKSRANEEWGNAITHYKKALSIDPYLLTAHYRLAYAYNEVGNLDKAIETYKGILQIAPHYARTEANIGELYRSKDMPDEALLYFKKAEALNPYDVDLLCSMGSLYIRLNDPKNAKHYLGRVLVIDPKNAHASKIMRKLK